MATLDFSPVVQDASVTKPAFTLTPNPIAPSPTRSALGVPATTPASLATHTSTPASISQQPFAATAPGLTLNTILGIPKATVDVTKQILQAIPRGVVSIAETVTPGLSSIDPTKTFGPVVAAAIGTDPITDIQTKAAGVSHFLQQYGLSPKTSDSIGTFMGVGGTLLDVFPAGSEEKKGIETAAKLTGEELLSYFAKADNPEKIAGVLKIIGHPEAGIEETSRAMVQAKTSEEVQQLLKGGLVKAGESSAVTDFKTSVKQTLGRDVALTAREKRLIEAGPNSQMLHEGIIAEQRGARPQLSPQAVRPTTLGSGTTFRSAGDVLGLNGATQIGQGEAKTLERQAEEYLSRAGREEDVRALRDAASLKRIVEDYQTPVEKKINLLDYIRTPEKVLTKIGLGPEAKYLRNRYEGYLKELPVNIDRITEWTKEVPASSNVRLFQYLDGKAIDLNPTEKKVAEEIKTYLSDWADRLGLPADKRVANYITHLFDDQLIRKEFDENLAKIIRDKIPGEVYDPFLEKRLGALGYKEDTWAALDAYTKRATRKFYMDPALARISDKAQSFEDSQWSYVKRYLDGVNMRPMEIENLIDNGVKQIFGYRGGQRPFTKYSQKFRQMTYRGLLGLNVGSAVRNLTQGVNTYAELGEKYTAKGYIDLMRHGTKELQEVGVLNDDFIQDRTISAVKSTLQKIDKGLFAMFEAVEKINRGSAYYGAKARALAQGKDELTAVEEAKELVRKTQFSLGKIDTPVALQSDLVKTLLQFQSFTLKQAEFLSGKVAKKEWAGLIRYMVGSLAILATLGKLYGMKWQDIIPVPLFNSGSNPGLSTPPTFQPVKDTVFPLYSRKDKNGNPLTAKSYFQQLGADLVPFIPAGAQVKKTLQGVGAVVRGKVKSASGKSTLFKVPQDKQTLVRAALFGKSNLPAARAYYSKLGQPKKKSSAKLAF